MKIYHQTLKIFTHIQELAFCYQNQNSFGSMIIQQQLSCRQNLNMYQQLKWPKTNQIKSNWIHANVTKTKMAPKFDQMKLKWVHVLNKINDLPPKPYQPLEP